MNMIDTNGLIERVKDNVIESMTKKLPSLCEYDALIDGVFLKKVVIDIERNSNGFSMSFDVSMLNDQEKTWFKEYYLPNAMKRSRWY